MSWFAKRPLAQSRAAVLCSLLPWPEEEPEQQRVQAVLKEALGICQDTGWYSCANKDCGTPDCSRKAHMQQASRNHAFGIVDCAKLDPSGGYNAARTDVLGLLKSAYPDRPAEMLDPFSGRGLIPLEAARYGQKANAIDYSPVATLASRLLIDWPFRDWSEEPELPFAPVDGQRRVFNPADPERMIHDIELVQAEVQRRIGTRLDNHYPNNARGEKPWGYLWAQVIPCDGCGRDFPLYGSNLLRNPVPDRGDPGQSFEIRPTEAAIDIVVVDYVTDQPATVRSRDGRRGKLAWCPYPDCNRGHEKAEHKAVVAKNFQDLRMLVVSDLVGSAKKFRSPTPEEIAAPEAASHELANFKINGHSARPTELIGTANTSTVRAVSYGARNFGDLSVDRQNLLNAVIADSIAAIARELTESGISSDYAGALAGYLSSTFVKRLKSTTRGARLKTNLATNQAVDHIFINESSVGFNYDSFETGIGKGPSTWESVSIIPSALSNLSETPGMAARVQRGSALSLPFSTDSIDAVVTDPPYEMMIDYTDASDLFFVCPLSAGHW